MNRCQMAQFCSNRCHIPTCGDTLQQNWRSSWTRTHAGIQLAYHHAEVETDRIHFTRAPNGSFWARFTGSLILLIPLPTYNKAFSLFRDVQEYSRVFTLITVTFAVNFCPFTSYLRKRSERLSHTSQFNISLSSGRLNKDWTEGEASYQFVYEPQEIDNLFVADFGMICLQKLTLV
jgi:hypothetical protein